MKYVLAAAAMLAASVAHADDSVMASRFGNTTIATNAAGVQTRVYYNADGTYTAKQADLAMKGTWKLSDGKLCLGFDQPLAGTPNPICAPVSAHQVGETWSADGQSVTLVKGIQ